MRLSSSLLLQFFFLSLIPSVVSRGAFVSSTRLLACRHRQYALDGTSFVGFARTFPVASETRKKFDQGASVDQSAATSTSNASFNTAIIVAAALASSVLLPSIFVPWPGEAATVAADVVRGQKIFESNCAACHAGGGNAFAKDKTLYRSALERYLRVAGESEQDDVERVRNFVQDGLLHRGAMLFDGRLTDAEYVDVSGYVVNQALGAKW